MTLINDVPALSVFFYRGDSYGEGGSNQRWLEPVLFHAVLGRLLDGGLIVGSANCGSGIEEVDVPWKDLCARANVGQRFRYAGRDFVCVGRIKNSAAWQVSGS